jgi:FkbM family methyltransferase
MNEWLDSTVAAYISHFGFTKNPVIWEVGSRDGVDAEELGNRILDGAALYFWDNATVVAIEANPDQATIIRKTYPRIKIIEVAASNVTGTADFIVYHGDEGAVGSSSLNLRWKGDDLEGHIIKVKTERLDNLIGDEQIDIMKIDVEGHSVEVLEGLGDKLKQVKVFHIETEKWTDSNIKVKAFMSVRGFRLVDEQEQYGGMPDQVWLRG